VSIAARHYRRSRCSPVELRDGRAAAARRRAAVAGLEALLALHEIAGERIKLTLIAPDPDSSYRTMAVAEPFALGSAQRVPLRRFTEETGPSRSGPPSPAWTTPRASCGSTTAARAPSTP
jgi:hypothetical protein